MIAAKGEGSTTTMTSNRDDSSSMAHVPSSGMIFAPASVRSGTWGGVLLAAGRPRTRAAWCPLRLPRWRRLRALYRPRASAAVATAAEQSAAPARSTLRFVSSGRTRGAVQPVRGRTPLVRVARRSVRCRHSLRWPQPEWYPSSARPPLRRARRRRVVSRSCPCPPFAAISSSASSASAAIGSAARSSR